LEDFAMQNSQPDRRTFIATAAAATSAALVAAQRAAGARSNLALYGGTPVRASRLEAEVAGPQYYDDEERRALIEVLETKAPFRYQSFRGGPPPDKCTGFEREFAEHQHARYCVAVTSGTMALYTAMAALDIGPGDEVILPTYTWYACYNSILSAGALPVFAEIDDSMNIDPADIEHRITPRTKAIMAVHLLGEPADMDPIITIAQRHHLKVLEDSAQSVGATYKGRPVGSIGDCGTFSFQVSKTISAGEGGAVITNDPEIFERAARFSDVGFLREVHAKKLSRAPHYNIFAAGQFRMNEFTGAVMRAQVRKLDRIVADYRDKGIRVTEAIHSLEGIRFRKLNDEGGLRRVVFIRAGDKGQRDELIRALEAENIAAGPMEGSVMLPMVPYVEQKQTLEAGWPSFQSADGREIRYGADTCRRSHAIYASYAGIYMDPKFSDQDVADIIAAVRKVYPAVM
jgi:8-amino-3,8-dideoxy-alpha-D-manno-octulosonate transaminase